MGKRRLSTVGFVALLSALLGCSLAYDLSGLAGGRADGGDASVEAASVDAGQADAPSVNARCANTVLCQTFDDPVLGLLETTTDPSTRVELDDKVFRTPPRSARFTIEPSTSDTSPDATLRLRASSALDAFVLTAELNIERTEPMGAGQLLKLTTGDLLLVLRVNGTLLESSVTVASLGPLPTAAWLPVRIEVRTNTQPATAIVSIGAKSSGTIQLAAKSVASPANVELGVSEANSPTAGWVVRWDEVIVRPL